MVPAGRIRRGSGRLIYVNRGRLARVREEGGYTLGVDARPENLKTAMEILRAELELAVGDSDSLDQKALLIPGFTVALAAFVLGPTAQPASVGQGLLVGAALFFGALTVIAGFLTLRPTATHLGPSASQLGTGLGLDPADFDLHVVGSLVQAVDSQSASNISKSKALWSAMRLAVATVICVVAARLVGGA